jgi:hypothetical protein
VETRDESELVQTLFATPLRVERVRGDVAPGLCKAWTTRRGTRRWLLICDRPQAVAHSVRRLVPGAHVAVRGKELDIRLPFAWRRFPYLLTSARAAVADAPGRFRIVSARPGRIVAARGHVTVVFEQIDPHTAAVRFRRGELDEAPVPLGDIRAAQLDPVVAPSVQITPLLAVDAVVFDMAHGALAGLVNTRNAYWQTAGRGDYQALVPEERVPAAVSLLPGYAPKRAKADAFRAARQHILDLPPVTVGIGSGPGLAYGRDLLVGVWRDVNLRARAGGRDAELLRVAAAYPQDEAVLAALLQRRALPGRREFIRALGAIDQDPGLRRADAALFQSAAVVPVSWAVDARFVSPRLTGWHEDRLGVVDYARVRFRESSRRP